MSANQERLSIEIQRARDFLFQRLEYGQTQDSVCGVESNDAVGDVERFQNPYFNLETARSLRGDSVLCEHQPAPAQTTAISNPSCLRLESHMAASWSVDELAVRATNSAKNLEEQATS